MSISPCSQHRTAQLKADWQELGWLDSEKAQQEGNIFAPTEE